MKASYGKFNTISTIVTEWLKFTKNNVSLDSTYVCQNFQRLLKFLVVIIVRS